MGTVCQAYCKFGPLREPIRILLFISDQFAHIINSRKVSIILQEKFQRTFSLFCDEIIDTYGHVEEWIKAQFLFKCHQECDTLTLVLSLCGQTSS